ncbi:MAG: hypothetical protein ABL962_14145, partial [Fimbriimonadaceae bacterium]
MPKRNPWLFIPLLFFLEAMPVTMVQEVAAIVYKDLGIQNESIVRWTSLIGIPWAMQMIFGPLVDLNFTKRWWITSMQAGIAVCLIVAAFAIKTPFAFELSLFILAASGFMSALCNVAIDGFALLAMDRTQQAQFAGIMSTFYRLGRLFCVSLLVFVAGLMMKLPPLGVEAKGEPLVLKKESETKSLSGVQLVALNGLLGTKDGFILEPPITVPPGVSGLRVTPQGEVYASRTVGEEHIGKLPTASGPFVAPQPVRGHEPATVWVLVLLWGALVYGTLALVNRRKMPHPEQDVMKIAGGPETIKNVKRTGYLLMAGLTGYFTLNAIVRISAHGLFLAKGGNPNGAEKGWMLPANNSIPLIKFSAGPIGTELIQLVA